MFILVDSYYPNFWAPRACQGPRWFGFRCTLQLEGRELRLLARIGDDPYEKCWSSSVFKQWKWWLVGGIPTPLKNISQLGWFPTIWKVKKIMFQSTKQMTSWDLSWFIDENNNIYNINIFKLGYCIEYRSSLGVMMGYINRIWGCCGRCKSSYEGKNWRFSTFDRNYIFV